MAVFRTPGDAEPAEVPRTLVSLEIAHENLRSAVAGQLELLRDLGSRVVVDQGGENVADVVLTTTRDATPARCRHHRDRGARVVVLASFPSEPERRSYVEAGVLAYVPMLLGREVLLHMVRVAAEGPG